MIVVGERRLDSFEEFSEPVSSGDPKSATPCRIAYLSGPIDAGAVYDDWRRRQDSKYYGTIYLIQLYEIIERLRAEALVITTLPTERSTVRKDGVTVTNIPMPKDKVGLGYHASMVWWAIHCMVAILKFRADAALLTAGQDYFWVFRLLKLRGVRLLASLHCTLWPKFAPRRWHHRLLTKLNGHLFYPACDHIQGVSQEAIEQIKFTAINLRKEPVRFLATYDPARFSKVHPPTWPCEGHKFRLLYVGRLTANKGVIDLVHIMEMLERRRSRRFTLDICGTGPAYSELLGEIEMRGLNELVTVHGQCNTSQLSELYSHCHAVVVPTRSDFEEGTPKVAFEAVLNFRPVILSAACPALFDVADAALEPKVDDVNDYAGVIENLACDPVLYRAKVKEAANCRLKHFDENNSYGSKLFGPLSAIARGKPWRDSSMKVG